MLKLSLLFCCFSSVLLYGQTIPQKNNDQLALRHQVKENFQAKREFQKYQLKSVGGAVVGTIGVILLNHSLGTISPRRHHKWEQTLLATGLIGTGLWITKGAKNKRKKAMELVQKKK